MSSIGAHRAWARAHRDGIEAHFPGVCRKCDVPIKPGDLIAPVVGGGFAHIECASGADDDE